MPLKDTACRVAGTAMRHLRHVGQSFSYGARRAAASLSRFNFITLHHLYFGFTCLSFSGLFYGASRPLGSVAYVDSLFLTVSAMTLTGLNTVNLSTLNTVQQVMLFFLIFIGSSIFVSGFVVLVRKNAFEHRFAHVNELRKTHRLPRASALGKRLSRSLSRTRRGPDLQRWDTMSSMVEEAVYRRSMANLDAPYDRSAQSPDGEKRGIDEDFHDDGSGDKQVTADMKHSDVGVISQPERIEDAPLKAYEDATHITRYATHSEDEIQPVRATSPVTEGSSHARITFEPNLKSPRAHRLVPPNGLSVHSDVSVRKRHLKEQADERDVDVETLAGSVRKQVPFLNSGTVSRNSQFSQLSEKERKDLGGYEYKAICLLSWLVPAYFILFQLLGCLGLGAYVANNRASTTYENGLNPWWVGAFNAVSAFNNSGMSLLDANMIAFQTSVYMLLTMSLLILAGNTCYPIFLRLIVWCLLRLLPQSERWEDQRNTLRFLLDHPRRCYTNLFPSQHTWWLLFIVIVLNATDWAAFELLNIGNKTIDALTPGIRVIDGLFQAFAVRSGGFYVVPIGNVRIGLQVLYVIMMYISVYPVVITMRNTNVYEERSLGIYADDPDYVEQKSASKKGFFARILTTTHFEETTQYFVRHQLRAQLSHDLWGIVLAVFLIMCFEAGKFERNPAVYSVFNVIFETVSAYGCVGISVGLPDQAYSFAGALSTCSKLVLCAVMIRGRHRGLPVAIDKAILLPREELNEAEEDDAAIRMERTASRGRMA